MNPLTKSKIISYLAIIFVAGGVTGAVISWAGAKQKWTHPPDSKDICEHFRHRLQSELDLTPQQVGQLEPILRKRGKDMEAVHDRTVREIEAIIRASNEEIATTLQLSPGQRAKLAEVDRKRQEFMRNRFKPHDAPPP